MEEREIVVIDMLADIMLHWRSIIVFMLIGGILAGAFSYVKSSKEIAQIQVQTDETEDDWEEILTDTQTANVNNLIVLESVLDSLERQMDDSIIMQIDPDDVKKIDVTFYIKSATADQAYSTAIIYENMIGSADMYEYVAGKTGEDANRLDDIISEKSYIYSGQGTSAEYYGSVFKVSVIHYDEKTCKNIARAIEDYLEDKHDYVAETVGAHDLMVAGYSEGTVDSSDILDSQNSKKTDIANRKLNIAKTKDAFSEDETKYYTFLTHTVYELEEEEEKIGQPSVSAKYALIGVVGMAFVYICILAVVYIVDNKLKGCDNLQELYGISVLGTIPNDTKKEKMFGFIDDKIYDIKNSGRRKFTVVEATKLASVAVKMAAKENAITVVSLVGNDLKNDSYELCEKIKADLEGENIKVKVLDNVLYDAEVMGRLENTDGMVLIEKVGSSMYTEVLEELELAKRQNVRVLGGILVC